LSNKIKSTEEERGGCIAGFFFERHLATTKNIVFFFRVFEAKNWSKNRGDDSLEPI
jgi:hypothetical protein